MKIWKAAALSLSENFMLIVMKFLRDTSADLHDLLFAVIFTKKP